jgi:hypothetical protein
MAGYVKPQVQGFVSKSTVIGEFVDAIPEVKSRQGFGKDRTSWAAQEGVREALAKAFANPGKAMLLLEYDEGAQSVRKKNAKLRVMSLERQGYTEDNGWIIRAVDAKIYALYQGVR